MTDSHDNKAPFIALAAFSALAFIGCCDGGDKDDKEPQPQVLQPPVSTSTTTTNTPKP